MGRQGDWAENVRLELHEGEIQPDELLKVMYFRTAYRHEPEFALGQIIASSTVWSYLATHWA
jgi:hypothetical protein